MAEHLELVAEIPKVEKLTVQERLEYAKKRRAQQLRRWEREKDSDSGPPPRKKKFLTKPLTFEPQFMLLDAATRGDANEVKSLLDSGVDPNICNDDGLTALHQACIDGKEEIIDILLDHGAILDSVDRELWTPLHAATACGNEDIVEYLLDQGADIVAINADGNMPIDLAEDDDELREILEAEMEEQGYTKEKLMQLKEEEEKKMLSDLKNEMSSNENMDLDQKNEQGATMVHIAAANCYEDTLEFLLEHGAGVDIPDKDGWLPIHGAAVWGNEQVLEMLVESGADLDSKTPQGETPLSLCEDPELQQFLVDLKNKVKANKKQSGKRKRSNSRSLSVKRTSLKDKISISHSEAKAEAILRVHPQLAFLLPKGNEAKQQEQSNKPMDVTPAVTTGQATQNSTTTTNISASRQETRPEQPDKTSSLTRPRGKENIDPVTRDSNTVAKDKKYEETGTNERKGSLKITVKTHTTTIDNKPKGSEQDEKPRSPRATGSPREPKSDVTIATSGGSGSKEARTSRLPRGNSGSKESSPPACSLVSITTQSGSPERQADRAEPRIPTGVGAGKYSSTVHRDSSLPRKPLSERDPKTDSHSNIVSKDSSLGRSKTIEEPKSGNRSTMDVNSNSKPVSDAKFNHAIKKISRSSDNLGPKSEIAASGTGSLPKSTKTRHAPPPPLPRSSGSLSRNHEPEDTSGYPDSFSKRTRNSRENILDVVSTGRLGTPETKPVSPGDVRIEATAGTAKYTPTKEPYSNHDRPTNQTTNQPTSKPTNQPFTKPTTTPTTTPTKQPTTRPSNQPSPKPTKQATNRPSNQPTKSAGQPTNTKQGQYTERYTKRDENDVLANDKVMYQDHVDVEREKKTCCVIV